MIAPSDRPFVIARVIPLEFARIVVLPPDYVFVGPIQLFATVELSLITSAGYYCLRSYVHLRIPQLAKQVLIALPQVPTMAVTKPQSEGDRP